MHVLVPVDDSDPARAALEHAITTFPDAEITVLHVINPSISAYDGDVPYNFQRAVEAEEEEAERLFDAAREFGEEHDASIATETIVGAPARGIVEFADDADVDGIVLGSHGRSGISRVLLGSVAEQVVRRASVPVTVVR
ncbi:universal stress protein [Halosolutus halophilus]|uniref:universal stress protein n=1 Tax=Halosolutus halophilus TaxID=1552990 RepID=UPI0022351080|nr:universal stress protein [Halosolutus halophilus]